MIERRLVFALINARKEIPLVELVRILVDSFHITKKQAGNYIRNFIERKENVEL